MNDALRDLLELVVVLHGMAFTQVDVAALVATLRRRGGLASTAPEYFYAVDEAF